MTDTGSAHHRRLLDILDLHPSGKDRWIAPTPGEGPPRLFGGQVASQALRALTLTVEDDRRVHSLHSYFIRPGRPGVTLRLDVERTRDGRSFSTRRVTASQDGEAIFVGDASFHITEKGDDWQESALPDVPGPDEVSGWGGGNAPFRMMNPFEIRPIRPTEGFHLHPCWVRVRDPLPDDPALHAAALTYVSDLAVIGSARAPGSTAGWGGASLDHSAWFHRPVRVDEWLLFSVDPVTNYGARGLAKGTFHRRDGVLVASVAQEALLRPAP
jgi:acyl-CoA thioesterase-2